MNTPLPLFRSGLAGALMFGLGAVCSQAQASAPAASSPAAAQPAPAAVSPAAAPVPAQPSAPPAAPAPDSESPSLPKLIVVGDSTANNNSNGGVGWGNVFASYFDPSKVTVLNRAIAGRSSRSYTYEGRWARVLEELRPGDVVLLQMGHNDGGDIANPNGRPSLPGLGDESRDITRANGQPETVHTYGWYMRQFIAGAKAKGATPVIFSLTVRNRWTDGKVERGSGSFGTWSAELAQEQNIQFVDLTNIIADEFDAMGPEKVAAFYPRDHTHTNRDGAEFNASHVVAGLKTLPANPTANWYSEKGAAIAPAPKPSLTFALSPKGAQLAATPPKDGAAPASATPATPAPSP